MSSSKKQFPTNAPAADSPAKKAVSWLHTARFLTTSSELNQLPQSELPEFAFVGRSNAGKSSAINALTQQGRLAFASKTPGRTQHINLFALGPKDAPNAYLADLPGYGYAAVARGAKWRWQKVMADYLEVRRSLAGVVLMVDSRLGLTDLDQQLLRFVQPRVGTGEVKLLVLLTKADKLNRAESDKALRQLQEQLGEIATEAADIGVTLFSSLKKTGVEDAAVQLRDWIDAQPQTPGTEADSAGDGAVDRSENSDENSDEGLPAAGSGAESASDPRSAH